MIHPHNLLYAPPSCITSTSILFSGTYCHYITDVLRLQPGDSIQVTDGRGKVFAACISSTTRSKVLASITAQSVIGPPASVRVDIAFAPIKGSRNDLIIEKGTELGVRRFMLFPTRFSVVKNPGAAKVKHLERIAVSAMIQSQRFYLPSVELIKKTKSLVQEFSQYDLALLGDPSGSREIPGGKRSLLWIVGPEGGLAPEEINLFQDHGAVPVSLGSARLRSETAALSGLVKILVAYQSL
ncbi:MAG TPA: RsmE family RNA methyltransferase [bacterium]